MWVPRRVNLYAGVAGGAVWYRFEQDGDFVDFETLDIFGSYFVSKSRGATVHFMGGVDVTIDEHLMLVSEARYSLGNAPVGTDFVGFPNLDLSGLLVTAGISFRY